MDVRRIKKVFGKIRDWDGVDIKIEEGEINEIMGEKGEGK